jgi:transposase, IS5 family
VLRTVNAQPTLWEAILPEAVLGLPAELEAVDRLLDDQRFFEPYRGFFHATLGRPSVPIETYLRLMFLKYRYQLGFEPLCREVSDSISWQRFCRIPLGSRVPHPTTLVKITSRCGERAVAELNDALIAKAAESRLIKMHKLRADTTVVEANVAYPVDSSLLAKGIARIATLTRQAKAAGLATRTRLQDRSRRAHRRARGVVNTLRRRGELARDELRRLNAELAQTAAKTVREADAVVRNARRKLRSLDPATSGRARAIIERLAVLAGRVDQIAAQTRQRVVDGVTPEGATRLVSLHDPDARPIRKGRLGRPVEFGYKAQVVDNADGIVLDWQLEKGNPPDAPQLAPAIERIRRRTGKVPRAVTADRGYGEAAVDNQLTQLGVTKVRIPRKGRPGAARRQLEASRPFQRMVRWRTGAEGRISCIKRDFGCRRTRMDTLTGARTWTGHGIFAHNLTKIVTVTT